MFSYSNDNPSLYEHLLRWANFKVAKYANDKLWSALYMMNELNLFLFSTTIGWLFCGLWSRLIDYEFFIKLTQFLGVPKTGLFRSYKIVSSTFFKNHLSRRCWNLWRKRKFSLILLLIHSNVYTLSILKSY